MRECDQPFNHPPDPLPPSCPRLPSGLPKSAKRCSPRQTRKALAPVALLLQDYSSPPNCLKDPGKYSCGTPPPSSRLEGPDLPQPMRLPPWAEHIRFVHHPYQRRKDPPEAALQGVLHFLWTGKPGLIKSTTRLWPAFSGKAVSPPTSSPGTLPS